MLGGLQVIGQVGLGAVRACAAGTAGLPWRSALSEDSDGEDPEDSDSPVVFSRKRRELCKPGFFSFCGTLEGDCVLARLMRRRAPTRCEDTERLHGLAKSLFHILDRKANNVLDDSELKSLNRRIGLLLYNQQVVESEQLPNGSEMFRDRLNPSGGPVVCEAFCKRMLQALGELDPDKNVQESLLGQFIADAQVARATWRQTDGVQRGPLGNPVYTRKKHVQMTAINEHVPRQDSTSSEQDLEGFVGAVLKHASASAVATSAPKTASAKLQGILWPSSDKSSRHDAACVSKGSPRDPLAVITNSDRLHARNKTTGMNLRSALWPLDDETSICEGFQH